MAGVSSWWNNWACCCGDNDCVSGGCPTGTYQATPAGSQTEKGHGGPCAFWDLQNAPGGWGAALVLTFLEQSTGNSFGYGTGLPLLPSKDPNATAVVSVTEGASGTPAYDHPKKGACQYIVYIEDGGGNVYPTPGDDSYVKMTRKSDGSIDIVVRFQPIGSDPLDWTDQKRGTGSNADHYVSGKTYNTSTTSWDSWGSTTSSGSDVAREGVDYKTNVRTDLSPSYKGCCGHVYGTTTTTSINLGGGSGSTTGGAAH